MKMIKSQRLAYATAIAAALAGQAALAAPPNPSSWDFETTFVPGATPTAVAPWETRAATGANCDIDAGPVTVPWTALGQNAPGVSSPALVSSDGFPLFYKNIGNAPINPGVADVFHNQVVLHPGDKCAVLRFVAPVDGLYKVNGEFFSTGGSHPNSVRAHVLDKGAQVATGFVSVPANVRQWIIPSALTYQLHAGETISFAVDDGGDNKNADTTLLSARVAWIDVLPPAPGIFKASNFDFEGDQGCAIEQGSNKTYCWGANAAGQLGGYVGASSNKAALAQHVEGYLAANGGGNISNIQVGRNNVCAKTTTGKTICWGSNNALQSGVASGSTTLGQNAPYGVADITAQLGTYQGARLDSQTGCMIQSGNVRCWGNNQINSSVNGGQLGWKNGSVFTNSALPLNPVPNVTGATDVAPGNIMSCAVVEVQKKVICWSRNPWASSILGAGYPSAPLLTHPDPIWQTYVKLPNGSDLTNVKRVAANGSHACALTNGGTMYCWGLANYGAAGAPVGSPVWTWSMSVANTLHFPAGATDFALNNSSTCVVAGAGAQVFCQGVNSSGQLGDPDMAPNKMFTFNPAWPGVYGSVTVVGNLVGNAPKPIAGLSQVVKIRSGQDSNTYCALKSDGSIWCWGKGSNGQLGNGTNSAASPTPVQVIK